MQLQHILDESPRVPDQTISVGVALSTVLLEWLRVNLNKAFVIENVLGLAQRFPGVLATSHDLLREAGYVRH